MREIRISTITVRDNVRHDGADVSHLTDSIRDIGLIQPVLVRRSGDGYELVAGHRRLAACKALGMEQIPAIIHDSTDSDRAIHQLEENIQRRQLSAYDIGLALRRIMHREDWTISETAEHVHKSYPWVYQHLDYCTLRDDLITAGVDAATVDRIPYDTLLELKHVPIDDQVELVKQMIGPDPAERCQSRFKVRRLIEARRTKPRKQREGASPDGYLVTCDDLRIIVSCESLLQRRKVLQLLLEHGGTRG